MLYTVGIFDDVEYVNIEAESESEAIEQALEWWNEREPGVYCTVQEKEVE